MRDFLENHGPVVFLVRVGVHGVLLEENILKVGKLRALGDLIRVPDLVVRDVESVQFLEGSEVIKPLNLIVAEPELLEGGGNIFEILNSLDVVASKGENFQILKTLHGDDLDNSVSGQG